jgi:hypothetical protein
MEELIPTYYESDTVLHREALRPGALYTAPIFFVDSDLNLLKIQYIDPNHKKPSMLQIGKADEDSFNHPPVIDLGLRDDEELAAIKCKRRPVIIFSRPLERWKIPNTKRQEDTYLCFPIYGLDQYDREFALSLRAFKYESAFYIPTESSFALKEGFIRFDRIQIVDRHLLKRWQPSVKLHDDALLLLQEWFSYYTTGSAADWVLEHQKAELEKLGRILAKQSNGSSEAEKTSKD